MLLKDCQKLTAITSCYAAIHQSSQTNFLSYWDRGREQRSLIYVGIQDLASLFSSRSIHEFGFLVNVHFQKISILPPTEGIGISWGMGGSGKSKNMKKCMKLYWDFQRGGEVWIFSGTTQCLPAQSCVDIFFITSTWANYPRMILKYILCCEQSHGK